MIRHDYADAPEYEEQEDGLVRMRVRDILGVWQRWYEDDEDPEIGSVPEPAPFVQRALFLGRAVRVLGPGPEREIR